MTEPLNEREISAILTRLDDIEDRLNAHERFRAWFQWAVAALVYMAGVFSDPVRKLLAKP